MKLKRENGITLIALVITIIVLLILAGVAVSIGLSGDSVFERANEAKTSWNTKVSEEDKKLGEAWNILNTITNGNSGGGSGAVTPTPVSSPTLPMGWNPDKVTEAYPSATDEQKAPIPVGFKVSIYDGETTIADGLVIYETTSLVADEDGSTANHDSAMTAYNQYVWIPVADINDMIMCDSHSSTSDCDIVIDEETGKIYCKNHMTVADAELTNTDTKFLCGRLYGGGSSFGTQNPATYTYDSGLREPAVVTYNRSATNIADYLQGTGGDAGGSFILKENGETSGTGASNILTELKRQFNAMAKSVATYGGFYVGRYEAGYVDDACTSRKATPVANVLNAGNYNASANPGGAGNWYGLYNRLIQSKTGIVSQMMWGCQWDQVMKFVNGKTDGNGDPYIVTSAKVTSDTTRHTGSIAVTGANINDLVQNIYDIEGNFYEWISTANVTSYRVQRGGSDYDGNSPSASRIGGEVPTISDKSYYSSRQSLYVSL